MMYACTYLISICDGISFIQYHAFQLTFGIVKKDSLGTSSAALQHIGAFRTLAADITAFVHSGGIPASAGRAIWEAITCSWKYRCSLLAIFLSEFEHFPE